MSNKAIYYKTITTNADRIRAMSDEELAEKLLNLNTIECDCKFCKSLPECTAMLDKYEDIPQSKCKECMLEWLRQPAEEVE